jgi:glycosyltransferase involved in cell wall biosynthesis
VTVPLVSIGIRASRRDHLSEAIASALDQTFGDFELIVADDHGRLQELVEGFGDDRVRYIRNPAPLGLNGNARRVLSVARGRFVGLLDDDDVLLPGFLEAVISRFTADPTLGVVFANHLVRSGAEQRVRDVSLAEGRHGSFLFHLLQLKPVATSATLMRREIWDDGTRRFQPVGSVERGFLWYSIVLNAAELGWAFYYIDEPLMVYRVHQSQASSSARLMREYEVDLWERFSFADDRCERLRQNYLASALLSRAAILLGSQPQSARVDVAEAFALARGSLGPRGYLIAMAAAHPSLVPAVRLVRKLRTGPARHRGASQPRSG